MEDRTGGQWCLMTALVLSLRGLAADRVAALRAYEAGTLGATTLEESSLALLFYGVLLEKGGRPILNRVTSHGDNSLTIRVFSR